MGEILLWINSQSCWSLKSMIQARNIRDDSIVPKLDCTFKTISIVRSLKNTGNFNWNRRWVFGPCILSPCLTNSLYSNYFCLTQISPILQASSKKAFFVFWNTPNESNKSSFFRSLAERLKKTINTLP